MSMPTSRPRSLSTSVTSAPTSSTTDKSLQFLLSRILLDLMAINTHITTLETTITTVHAHLSHTPTSLETSLYSTNILAQQQSTLNRALTDSLETLIRCVSNACVADECVRALEAEHRGMVGKLSVEHSRGMEKERKASEREVETMRGVYKAELQKAMGMIEEFQREERGKWSVRGDRVLDTVVWGLGELGIMVFAGAIGWAVRLLLVGGEYKCH